MPQLDIRPYDDGDEDGVLSLLAASLGKVVDDRYRGFFRWKHLDNPFGRSFMWVGEVDGRLAGFRSFLQWRFRDGAGDRVSAVRAVDTATHPDFRGMGIFRQLTMSALDELRSSGVEFVFNTPNDSSRPGYLKMGWRIEQRVAVQIRPASVRALGGMARARTAAGVWSLPVGVGEPVDAVEELVAAGSAPPGSLSTDRSPAFMRWRYGENPDVASRAVRTAGGAVLVRIRQRGDATECTVGDVLGQPTPSAAGRAVRTALHQAGATYAIASAVHPVLGMVRVPRLGPIQVRRDVAPAADTRPLALTLGDTELF